MADTYEQNLGQKSSLTTSDFIRVVGSDNVSYKQDVGSVMETMGLGTAINNGTDLNTLVLPTNDKKIKVYRGVDLSQMTNKPSAVSNAWPFCLILLPIGGAYTKQILHIYGTDATPDYVYVRTQTYSSGSVVWTNWQQSPTRAEITVLEKTVTGTTNIYGAISLGLPWRTNEILSVSTGASGQWCFPMAIGGYFWARVMTDGASYSVAANTDVELIVRYRPYTA